MLINDPPPGTIVRFTRPVHQARPYETATLVRAVRKYERDRPEDEFIVLYREEEITVQRQDIQKIEKDLWPATQEE